MKSPFSQDFPRILPGFPHGSIPRSHGSLRRGGAGRRAARAAGGGNAGGDGPGVNVHPAMGGFHGHGDPMGFAGWFLLEKPVKNMDDFLENPPKIANL